MRYELHFIVTAERGPVARGEIVDHFLSRVGYREFDRSSGVALYANEDTGVSFSFAIGAATPNANDHVTVGARAATLIVSYLRPHVFGLEAEREARALIDRFAFGVSDPQPEGMGGGAGPANQTSAYSSDGLLRGYAVANAAAHASAIGGGDALVLPSGTLTNAWRWNIQRAALQRMFGDRAFVPKIIWALHPKKTNEVVTALVWTRFMPALLPWVDVFILNTDETPRPIWVERTAVTRILGSLPTINADFRYDIDGRSGPEAAMAHYDARQAARALAPRIIGAATRDGDLPRIIPLEKVLSKEIARPAVVTTNTINSDAAAPPPQDAEAQWALLTTEIETSLRASDFGGAIAAARRAADAFTPSPHRAVRAFAHTALMTIASEGRKSGDPKHLDEAERAAKELVDRARRDGAVDHEAFASYELGLIALVRETPIDGVEPFRVASEMFARSLGPTAKNTVVARVNYGLVLLQCERYPEAAEVLRVVVDTAKTAPNASEIRKHIVPALHNLGLALSRQGLPKEAVPYLDEALHDRLGEVGINDPLYVDTELVKANALVDLGRYEDAGALLKHGALAAFQGGGEAHHLFAEALFIEARRAAKTGDGLRADALARRSLRMTEKDAGASSFTYRDRSTRAIRLRTSWRESTRLADPGGARQMCIVNVGHTLRRWQPSRLEFDESGSLPKTWYVDAPAPWAESTRQIRDAVKLLFATANDDLNAREPDDPNYLDVVDVDVRAVSFDDFGSMEWEGPWRDRVWEPSGAYVATVAGLRPITFAELGVIVTARLLIAKRMTTDDALESLTKRFGLADAHASEVVAKPIDEEARVVRPA